MKTSTYFYLATLFLLLFTSSVSGNNNPPSKFFPADIQEGLIGQSETIALDNPKDNIFHVQLDQALTGKEKIWLVYELYGVHNHTAVSRSINDQRAIGGYLVKNTTEWTEQKEQIHSRWLKEGNNVIRFSIQEKARFNYKVKNVGILIEQIADSNNQQERPVIINQPQNLEYFNNTAYIKGFIKQLDAQLFIDNKPVPTFEGEFEYLVNKPDANITNEWSANIVLKTTDGIVLEERIRFNQNSTADFIFPFVSNNAYKEKIISPNNAQSINLEGATLHFEAGCLEKETVISITGLRNIDIPPLDPGMVNVTKKFAGYRMLPDGEKFPNAVKIDLAYEETLIPRGYTKADIKTYFFNETSRKWVVLNRDSSQSKGVITSLTSHFTDFINGVIKVPESPQTSAYTPTSIKDIKAADPSAGINLMQAPVPNNMGTANIQHPIIIPAGRNGIQPNIALTYNSGADNSSWCGMGWDLSIPNISIDTRWGVPRYDSLRETEIYLFNGQQLKPANDLMVHRDDLKARNNNNSVKIFYPRVEGGFQKIVRYGNHPKEYIWEVIDKNGTRNLYGGTPEFGIEETSILRDGKRNIAHWALYETRDLNDNFVRYHCEVVKDRGVIDGNASMGQQIYIDSITYTGTGTQEGKYSISFDRDREQIQRKSPESASLRVDKTINARLGFKRVTADLLKRITVLLGQDTIRSCALDYEVGPFFKTRIKSITDYDAANQEFVKHRMEYYDEVSEVINGERKYDPYRVLQVDNLGSDGVEGNLKSPFADESTTIVSGSSSSNFSVGGALTIGPVAGNLFSKENTFGANYSYADSDSEGLISLVDINGDGLPDKVFIQNGFFFRPGIIELSTNRFSFGEKEQIMGIDHFSKSSSSTHSIGIEGHPVPFFLGATKSFSESKTKTYFSDFNGDGLIDLSVDGKVYFNHIIDGIPHFSTNSANSTNKIFANAPLNANLLTIDPQEQAQLEEDFPLHDVVRIWIAPYEGTIAIDGIVEFAGTSVSDGVLTSIQHQDIILWKDTLRSDKNSQNPINVNAINVSEKDTILFRTQSIYDGRFDRVKWNPKIIYTASNVLRDSIDANNKRTFEFNSNQDFVLSGPVAVGMPKAGRISIDGTFFKPLTSDSITIEIIKEGEPTPIKQIGLAWNFVGQNPVQVPDLSVNENDVLYFRVRSKSNVDWAQLHWEPSIEYRSFFPLNDPNTPSAIDADEESILKFFPAVDYQMFTSEKHPSSIWKAPRSGILRIQPIIHTNGSVLNQKEVVLTVKKVNQLLAYRIMDNGFTGNTAPIEIQVNQDDSLFFEYHAINRNLADFIDIHDVSISIDGTVDDIPQPIMKIGFHTSTTDYLFGHQYRNWGQFAYNGNKTRAEERVKLEELKYEFSDQDLPATQPDNPDDISIDPSKANFILMLPDGKSQAWIGQDNLTYFKKDTISSSRLGKDDIEMKIDLGGAINGMNELGAPIKISKSQTLSFAASAGPGGSWSETTTETTLDVIDLSGDRFPDVVSTDNIQYTDLRGGLVDSLFNHGLGNHKAKSKALSASIGGNFAKAKTDNTGSSQLGSNSSKAALKAKVSKASDNSKDAQETAASNVGFNANIGCNGDATAKSWMDVNGDGLPDIVDVENRTVQLNLGYSFAPEESWNLDNIRIGESKDGGLGLSINLFNKSTTAGVSVSRTENQAIQALMDVNGDGLVDVVTLSCTDLPATDILANNPLSLNAFGIDALQFIPTCINALIPNVGCNTEVKLNTGSGFAPSVKWEGLASIDKGSSTGESINGAFTGCIPIPILGIRVCLNPNLSAGKGVSRQNSQLIDIDGDGFPDFIESSNSDQLSIKQSKIGRTNKLKSISRPLGSSISLDYQRVGNTYDLPHNVWALSEIKIYDGFDNDGADTLLTKVDYKNGFYQRNERDFYGFDTIMIHQHNTDGTKDLYRTNVQVFENKNYYQKGLKTRDILQDAQGNKFTETIMRYDWNDVITGQSLTADLRDSDAFAAFPAMVEMRQNFYEGQPTVGKTTAMIYSYDRYGNVESYTDFGEDNTNEDNYRTLITYHEITANHIVGIPETMVVDDNNGNILRNRTTAIDPANGNILQINQYLTNGTSAQFNFDYYTNGNLESVIRPSNLNGERFGYSYEYDNVVDIYPTIVRDSFGYVSTSLYDYRFGKDTLSIDINGKPIHTKLDAVGRMVQITGPYEYGSDTAYTIKCEYHPLDIITATSTSWALTQHFDPEYPDDPIETVTFIDGLGRVLQVKKDATIYNPVTDLEEEKMIVSGRLKFDAFGRSISSRYPVEEPQGQQGVFNPLADGIQATTSEYDVLDRTAKIILPDNATTETVYSFGNDRNGIQQFSTALTDANGITKTTFADVRGRITSTLDPLGIWTSFEYNRINELLKVIDDHDNEIISEYDNFGRRTKRIHPDAGLTEFEFDLASNLIKKRTANIRAENSNAAIEYRYEFERLIGINYPFNNFNNVTYIYGEANDAEDITKNRMGRIKFQADATGTQIMDYGPLGEMVKNIRSIAAVPGRPVRTYTTRWRYDTWNRIQGIVYPDADILDYAYNRGGLLNGMTSQKFGAEYEYIKRLSYDKFEQRVRLTYGNDTETTYAYEPERRRLQFMTASTAFGRKMMDNVYTYDDVTNIKTIQNQALKPDLDRMGGPTEYTFEYDDMYRLTHATGCWRNKRNIQRYDLSMEYNNIHDITRKVQVHERRQKDVGQDEEDEDECDTTLSDWVESDFTDYRHRYFYESDQPHAATTIGPNDYEYDANGNLVYRENQFSSGQKRSIIWDEEDRLLVLDDDERIHLYRYDASNERVVKRASISQFMDIDGERVVSNDNFGDYTVYVNPYMVVSERGYTKHYFIENQRISTKLGLGGPFGLGSDWGNWELWTDWDNWDNWANTDNFDEWILGNEDWQNVDPDWNDWSNNREFFQYFFHPDHLGSSSYVSDTYGEAHQHVEYMPFGETFVQEHKNLDRTPYLFNGKELDEETGLYYYGARYYNPRTSRWLSVDPAFDEYLGIKPQDLPNRGVFNSNNLPSFSYSLNNPILYTDPNGEIAWVPILLYLAYTAVETVPDIAMDEAIGKATGEKPTLGDHALSYGINLIPGAGEANTAKKAAVLVGVGIKIVDKGKDVLSLVKLTKKGKSQIGNLIKHKDTAASTVLKLRGGKASAMRQGDVGGLWEKSLGEIANLAAKGHQGAKTVMKQVKQAGKKAQKYD